MKKSDSTPKSNGLEDAGNVVRFSVSLPPPLLERLDRMVEERGMPSRSQAIAEMINAHLIDHYQQATEQVMAGTITIVYLGVREELRARLTRIQRRFLKEVIASQHVFLENEHNLEVLLVQGPVATLHALRGELIACKGVQTAELTLTAALLPPLH